MNTAKEAVLNQISLCDHAPFGADLLTPAAPKDITQDTAAAQRLTDLRGQLQAIIESPHSDDQLFVTQANNGFRQTDLPNWPHRQWDFTFQAPLEWMLGATDTQLLRFLVDNAELQRANQQQFMRLLPELKEHALYNVDQGIKAGVVPRIARPLAEITLSQTTYVALDTIGSAEYFCRAYYHSDGIMGMANAYNKWQDLPTLQRVFTHETYHGLNMRAHAGFHDIIPRKKDRPTLVTLEEIWTEHATQVSYFGDPTAIDPDERINDAGSYRADRKLGSVVFADIPHDLIGEAYLEPRHGGKFPARKELNRRLRYNFPEYTSGRYGNIWHRIAVEHNAAPVHDKFNVLDKWITALSPGILLDETPTDQADVTFMLIKEPSTS